MTIRVLLSLICAMSASCSGIMPAVQKLDTGPEDICFIDRQKMCAPMLVCTTHIQVYDQSWPCDELDMNRNGRVDCLDHAEAFACSTMMMPRYFRGPRLRR